MAAYALLFSASAAGVAGVRLPGALERPNTYCFSGWRCTNWNNLGTGHVRLVGAHVGGFLGVALVEQTTGGGAGAAAAKLHRLAAAPRPLCALCR